MDVKQFEKGDTEKGGRRANGELMLKALELIETVAYDTADFIADVLQSGKGHYRRLYNPPIRYHKSIAEELREMIRDRRQLYNLFYRLEEDGLIAKSAESDEKIWTLTQKGKEKKEKLKARFEDQPTRLSYPTEPSAELVIVSFDVPEKERHKRVWLRAVLRNLNFRMLQQSLWIGKVKIPKEFIGDLKKHKMLPFVEIFSIGKRGTITHLS